MAKKLPCFSVAELRCMMDSDEYSIFAQAIAEELVERGWDTHRLMIEMGGDPTDEPVIRTLLCVKDKNILLDKQTAARLGKAFGVGAEFFLNLHGVSRMKY